MKRQDARDAKNLEEPSDELDRDVSEVLAAAIEVHRILGPGFLASVYEHALCERVVVELKAVDALAPIHWAQVRSYLKATGCRLGLLINFNVPVLLRGVRRIVLTT